MPLIEPQVDPAREQAPREHDGKWRVNNADDPSSDCSDEEKQRNVEVAQLAKWRIDENVVGHRLLDRNRKASQVAGHAMDVVVKEEVGVLCKQVQKQVRARCENGNRQVDNDEEYDHLKGAPERLQKLSVEEYNSHVTDKHPTVNLHIANTNKCS